MSALTQED